MIFCTKKFKIAVFGSFSGNKKIRCLSQLDYDNGSVSNLDFRST